MSGFPSSSITDRLPLAARNIELFSPSGAAPRDAPAWIWDVDHPYVHGIFAPVDGELEKSDLDVVGELPADLDGCFVLNSPNQRWRPGGKYHYYDGDGMLHAVYFHDGKVNYVRRWVRTDAFVREEAAGEAVWPGLAGPFNFDLPGGPIKDNSNTDIIFYAGRLLSLWYLAGVPYRVDPLTLRTEGAEDFGGRLRRKLSAHSKVDPNTGELIFFDYGNEAPYMTYGVADASGNLLREVPIDLPGPRSPHDIGVTPNYSILHDLPMFQDPEIFSRHGKRVVRFHRDVPARFGILPRHGDGSQVKWFEAEPCYILHVVNCWEEGDWIVMDACRQPEPIAKPDEGDGELAKMLAFRRRTHVLHRWRFNLRTGEVREGPLESLNMEFPRINPLFLGRETRYSYYQYLPLPDADSDSLSGRCQTFDALVRFDAADGTVQRWNYSQNGRVAYGNEAPFAPKQGATAHGQNDDAQEDDGYIVTIVTDTNDWESECHVFDARQVEAGPVARVKLGCRVPAGFHANWVDGGSLW
ncbi:MAG: dioxygenase [Chromatiales bacterium]|jgi:carotenoid cleavage dioxygenase-like enzyme|nr:dioxygenase [Chromatiales bacterium]